MERLLNLLCQDSEIAVVGLHPRMMEGVNIATFAHSHGVPVYESEAINGNDYVQIVSELATDLIISCNEKQIFKPPLIKVPRVAVLNLHCGYLPLQRGGGGLYSAFINEQEAGVTVHYVNEQIDAGEIVAQEHRPIGEHETIKDIQEWALQIAPRMYVEAIHRVIDGSVIPVVQSGKYTYTPAMPEYDNMIDWSEPSALIHNRVRARQSPVWCFTFVEKRMLFVRSTQLLTDVADYIGPVGQVIARKANGVAVKTGNNALLVTSVAYENDQPFIPAFGISSVFGINVVKEYFELTKRIALLEQAIEGRRR